jgi:prepilin-type N-terminal cleavage/methylation domain-containing protein
MSKKNVSKSGFTLLEILLVVGIIAILAGIVILAINPTKQLGDTRNAQRRSDVLTILNAVYQYALDNQGDLPSNIDIENDTLCDGTGNGIDASELEGVTQLNVASSTYLTDIPTDPTNETDSTDDSEYYIVKRTSGRITVCAPNSMGEGSIEEDDTDNQIEVTR